jgi:hypothetical protein
MVKADVFTVDFYESGFLISVNFLNNMSLYGLGPLKTIVQIAGA